MLQLAILDDYAGVALESAPWSALAGRVQVHVFGQPLSGDEAVGALQPFDVLCTLRERMSLPRRLLALLPNLKLITIVGPSLPNLDLAAATELGILVSHSNPDHSAAAHIAHATPELTWGLIIATVRQLGRQTQRVRAGVWQDRAGVILAGRTLALLGLGRIGAQMAHYGRAFGMQVVAWSQNLSRDRAEALGARYVSKDELFRLADVLSIHLRLSERTRGLVGARELALMRPQSYLVNTSRGPIVVESELIAALRAGRLAGAGLDVFDQEPLPADHPLRTLDNVVATPHLGYVTRETLHVFYGDTVEAVAAFAAGAPIRLANPDALARARTGGPPPCSSA